MTKGRIGINPEQLLSQRRSPQMRALRAIPAVLILFLAGMMAARGETSFNSPEESFQAARAALDNNDIRAFSKTLTPETVDVLIVGLGMGKGIKLNLAVAFAREDEIERCKNELGEFKTILQKHGLSEANLRPIKIDKDISPAELRRIVSKAVEPVKDRTGLLVELVRFSQKCAEHKKGAVFDFGKNPELKDVVVTGDTARGVLRVTKNGQESRESLNFRRVDGSWKIDVPIEDLLRKKLATPG
jgi:hypothetical protein